MLYPVCNRLHLILTCTVCAKNITNGLTELNANLHNLINLPPLLERYFYTQKGGDIMLNKDFDKKIEKMNLKIAEILCSIGVSMITAIITVLLCTR